MTCNHRELLHCIVLFEETILYSWNIWCYLCLNQIRRWVNIAEVPCIYQHHCLSCYLHNKTENFDNCNVWYNIKVNPKRFKIKYYNITVWGSLSSIVLSMRISLNSSCIFFYLLPHSKCSCLVDGNFYL